MDVKCVRVLRPYENDKSQDKSGHSVIHIDEAARYALNKKWGDTVEAQGRRKTTVALAPLAAMDQDGFIARASQEVIDALYIEYGEEILLH